MGIQFDEPRYAVGIYIDGRIVCLLETYQDRTSLEEGYEQWKTVASNCGLVKPVPGELSDCFMSADSETGGTKVTNARFKFLTDLLKAHE
ncbi:MAG: hypothetical protein Q8P81_03860 [Nanoarchaeota archaeon]|nr:hypothetical protein [Nanoarchaeota archaeon]